MAVELSQARSIETIHLRHDGQVVNALAFRLLLRFVIDGVSVDFSVRNELVQQALVPVLGQVVHVSSSRKASVYLLEAAAVIGFRLRVRLLLGIGLKRRAFEEAFG